MGHFAAEPVTDGGGDDMASAYIAAHIGSADWCGVGSIGVKGRSDSRVAACVIVPESLVLPSCRRCGANGHRSELCLPCVVKSTSKVVDNDVRLKLLLVPDILLLSVDPVDLPVRLVRRCTALRPSLIAIAICCLDPLWCLCGSGTNPACSEVDMWRSGGSCSFAKVLETSGSPAAYLSASC
jgi:hypothetical protein